MFNDECEAVKRYKHATKGARAVQGWTEVAVQIG